MLARRAALEADLGQARASAKPSSTRPRSRPRPCTPARRRRGSALSSLRERLRGTQHLAAERHRLLTEVSEPERPGRDPDELDRQAAELREETEALTTRLAAGREVLTVAVAERTAAEAELRATERRLADSARAAATRADRVARLREQVGAADSRSVAAREEMDRLEVAAEQARERAALAAEEYERLKELAGGRDEDRSGLAAAHEEAASVLSNHAERTAALRTAERESARELAALRARADALAEAVRRGADASAALLADPVRFGGVLGAFAARLQVAEGFEVAIAAALGAAADAVAVTSLDAAAEILSTLRREDAGSAGLVITGAGPAAAAPAAPPGTACAATLVSGPGGLGEAAAALLRDVVVTDDLAQARRVVRENPAVKAVTRAGDLLGSHWAHGGGARPQSLLELRAAADEAAAGLAEAERRCD